MQEHYGNPQKECLGYYLKAEEKRFSSQQFYLLHQLQVSPSCSLQAFLQFVLNKKG